jgi:hypothetical protein
MAKRKNSEDTEGVAGSRADTTQLSTKISTPIHRQFLAMFGSTGETGKRGRSALNQKQATEGAFSLFMCAPRLLRYRVVEQIGQDPEWWARLTAGLRSILPDLDDDPEDTGPSL